MVYYQSELKGYYLSTIKYLKILHLILRYYRFITTRYVPIFLIIRMSCSHLLGCRKNNCSLILIKKNSSHGNLAGQCRFDVAFFYRAISNQETYYYFTLYVESAGDAAYCTYIHCCLIWFTILIIAGRLYCN